MNKLILTAIAASALLLSRAGKAQCAFNTGITASGATSICGPTPGTVTLSVTSNTSNVWVQKANFGGAARDYAVGFSIGDKGYIGTGLVTNTTSDFWEYDVATNVWTQKADFGGGTRYAACGFSIGTKGYIGTGTDGNGIKQNDFWEYNPATNTWTQKASFGGVARRGAVGFSIGNKGYIGTGYGSTMLNDFWEYDPLTGIWTQKTNFGGSARRGAVGFSAANMGYIGTGEDAGAYTRDFYAYDPVNNTWTQKANFGGTARTGAVGVGLGNAGYIGTGTNGGSNTYNDFWQYNPVTDSWAVKTTGTGTGLSNRSSAVAFATNNAVYIGTGTSTNQQGFALLNDLLLYTPITSVQWSTGATTASISVTTSGTYSVTLTSETGCTASATQTVAFNPLPTITATTNNTLLCAGQSATLTANGGSSYNWSTSQSGADIVVSPTSTTTYTVNSIDVNGCSGSSTITQSVSLCTGIEHLTNSSLALSAFPNPNNGTFILKSTKKMELTLSDNLGRLIQTISLNELNNYQNSIEVYSSGIYFINGNFIRQKIVVTK